VIKHYVTIDGATIFFVITRFSEFSSGSTIAIYIIRAPTMISSGFLLCIMHFLFAFRNLLLILGKVQSGNVCDPPQFQHTGSLPDPTVIKVDLLPLLLTPFH
jgi:hypothetical protein